jgi:hypothetical protein
LSAILQHKLQSSLFNNHKPVLQHVQTHEIPFSRYSMEGISWFDVSITVIMVLLFSATNR